MKLDYKRIYGIEEQKVRQQNNLKVKQIWQYKSKLENLCYIRNNSNEKFWKNKYDFSIQII